VGRQQQEGKFARGEMGTLKKKNAETGEGSSRGEGFFWLGEGAGREWRGACSKKKKGKEKDPRHKTRAGLREFCDSGRSAIATGKKRLGELNRNRERCRQGECIKWARPFPTKGRPRRPGVKLKNRCMMLERKRGKQIDGVGAAPRENKNLGRRESTVEVV